jgi:hypothetical protein
MSVHLRSHLAVMDLPSHDVEKVVPHARKTVTFHSNMANLCAVRFKSAELWRHLHSRLPCWILHLAVFNLKMYRHIRNVANDKYSRLFQPLPHSPKVDTAKPLLEKFTRLK